jgi:hypothetical protein
MVFPPFDGIRGTGFGAKSGVSGKLEKKPENPYTKKAPRQTRKPDNIR